MTTKRLTLEPRQAVVRAYHYDMRDINYETEHGTPETAIKMNTIVMDTEHDADPNVAFGQDTLLNVLLQFMIVKETYVISGLFTQEILVKNKTIAKPEELHPRERRELTDDLLNLLSRMTNEVTEIALDEPGLELTF